MGRGESRFQGARKSAGSKRYVLNIEEDMTSIPIKVHSLKEYARSISGTTLQTRARRRKFAFFVDDDGFHYIPESTGKPRIQEDQYIERVLERFNNTRSFSPSDYQDITVNASYILAVIERCINS